MQQHDSRTRLLDATLKVVRAKGYAATRVEDVCAEAHVTKGSFFHHFKSKDDLALAAAAHWGEQASQYFAAAPYHGLADPLDRLLAYVDFRKAALTGERESERSVPPSRVVASVHSLRCRTSSLSAGSRSSNNSYLSGAVSATQ